MDWVQAYVNQAAGLGAIIHMDTERAETWSESGDRCKPVTGDLINKGKR